jgi:hypothetical protein
MKTLAFSWLDQDTTVATQDMTWNRAFSVRCAVCGVRWTVDGGRWRSLATTHLDETHPQTLRDLVQGADDGLCAEGHGELEPSHLPNAVIFEVFARVLGRRLGVRYQGLIDGGAVGRELIQVGDAVGEEETGAGIAVRFHVCVGKAGVDGIEESWTPRGKVSVVVIDERVLHFLHLDVRSKGFDLIRRPPELVLQTFDLGQTERRFDRVRDAFEELDALDEELGDELRAGSDGEESSTSSVRSGPGLLTVPCTSIIAFNEPSLNHGAWM